MVKSPLLNYNKRFSFLETNILLKKICVSTLYLIYLDLDLNLVNINMQNYLVIKESSEADWLDALISSDMV